MKESFFISFTGGCTRRRIDSERVKNYFIANGLNMAASTDEADYVVVSTCGLTKMKEDDAIKEMSRVGKLETEMIVTGCVPAMNAQRTKSAFSGRTLNANDLDRMDEFFPEFRIKFRDIPDANVGYEEPNSQSRTKKGITGGFDAFGRLKLYRRVAEFVWRTGIKTKWSTFQKLPYFEVLETRCRQQLDVNNAYFTLRILRGCIKNCSFCDIKQAIGNLNSKPIPVLLEEVKQGLRKEQYRINIVSSDSGSYGIDLGTNLPELLKAILALDSRITIEFIQDLSCDWMLRYCRQLIELNKTNRIKGILTATQSGSERILKLMNRPTHLDGVRLALKEMKRANPRLRLRTQMIVGFPTETEEDLEQTISFIKDCQFDLVDIFSYCERETTKSSSLQPKVPPGVIHNRTERLKLELSRENILSTLVRP
jgi:tRNA A37 methylthiotransferase MiaB